MSANQSSDVPLSPEAARQIKFSHRRMWGLGDYHRFATSTVWQLGPVLVDACGISAGQRVLDIATGTGNVAIRAARAGARVIASDLTPAHFDAGRRAAATAGVELEWREADAEALPFGDAEFDVVTSCFGVMFAPNHQAAADEMLRVCRRGGTIGLINFTPDGAGGEFFQILGRYAPPPPPGAQPPLLWGREAHVHQLLGPPRAALDIKRGQYVETAATPSEYCELFRNTFGPMVAIRAMLADQPERLAALDREFLEFVNRWNRAKTRSRVEIPYDYLLVIGRKHP
jgi:ubiquinone/menaquinone biosynthesis C-methylase UbiE